VTDIDVAIAVLQAVFEEDYARRFSVRFWDGTTIAAKERSEFTFVVGSAGALRAAFARPIELNAGRAFAAGLLDCEGDVESAVDTVLAATRRLSVARLARLFGLLRRLPKTSLPPMREARLRGRRHSKARDRAAVGFHYDQPVAFYQTFLDRAMVYSCGYFDDGVTTLDGAQEAKLDLILRKLRLGQDERFLDIGCGWGALVIAAARRGARSLGVTLSVEQHAEAQRRIEAAGLGDLAKVELRDYRDLGALRFDKIASIGMFEHVGREKLPEYFKAACALLEPGGLFLNHGIADESSHRRQGRIGGFVGQFVFPDGELVHIGEALVVAERAGFEVRDVENLREHYMRTLRMWVNNIERNRSAAIAQVGEQTYRIWRLYMAGSAQGFRTGRLGIFQSLLAKPHLDGGVDLPLTRRGLYA
jgi:cyclopropane-fatty-acyl-phospholipid synthase